MALSRKKARMPAPRSRRRIQVNPPKSLAQDAINDLKSVLNKAKLIKNQEDLETVPFSKYVASLMHANKDTVPTPLRPIKSFYKRIHYQDTITVNASGDLFAGGCLNQLARCGNGSSVSPILYCNDPAYSATSQTNSFTGNWNLDIVGTSGINVNGTAFSLANIQTAHIKFELSGVSNLNKQGQIHLFEDVEYLGYVGGASDSSYGPTLVNRYPVQDLPKCNHYKTVDIANMDSDNVLEYNFIPLASYANTTDYSVSNLSTSTQYLDRNNKNFGCVVTKAAVGTTIRILYDIVICLEVQNDYICDYPPVYSKTFVNPDPILAYMNTQRDLILHTHKQDYDHAMYTLGSKQIYPNAQDVSSSKIYNTFYHKPS
jgi:hypothetical protein